MTMTRKTWLMAGLFSMMLILTLVFSCGDLGKGDDKKEEKGPPPLPTVAAWPVLSDMASRNYTTGDTPGALSVKVINASEMGTLSFQWYSNTTLGVSGATPIEQGVTTNGAETSITPSAGTGDSFYYVVVTNTDETKDTKTSVRTSNIVRIRFSSAAAGTPAATITVNTNTKNQYIRGFGGMSSVWTSPEVTNADVDTMFSPDGLGYNLFRICIYPYMDDLFNGVEEAPVNAPDAHKNYYNMVRQAKKYGALILASPWTPPGEWKTNGTRKTGKLKPEHYGDYARHLKDYIALMAKNGAAIDYISTQNEPDIAVSYDGCEWTGQEMRDFISDYGDYIAPSKGTVKLMPGESFQFRDAYYNPIYNDSAAMASVGVIGGHIYGDGLRRHSRAIQAGKEVWMTEHLINTTGNFEIDSQWSKVWEVVKEFHDCMVNDFNGYIWWYSKRFYSLIGDGEYGTANGVPLFRGYALSHYAKYATGKTRVAATLEPGNANVFVTAYESDYDLTLVLINRASPPGYTSGTDVGQVDISIPFAAKGASMVITSNGTNAVTNNDTTLAGVKAMASDIVVLSADGKTGSLDLPASSIVSVRFTK